MSSTEEQAASSSPEPEQANTLTHTGTSGQRLGRPVLTTIDAIAQSLAIGPIFSTAFVAFLIAGAAGGAAPIAALIGAVGVLALGWVISLYARRYQGAGAIYDYLRRTHPAFGLFAAGMYFVGTLVLDCGGYLVIGLLVTQTLANYLNWNIPWWIISLVAAAALFAVNHFGIRVATRVQLTLTGLSVIPLLILALAIIFQGGDAGNTLQAFNPTQVPLNGIFVGVLFAITLFIGFETSASLGEETANPQRSIPRAVIFTVLIAAAFYLVLIYASDIGYGLNHTDKWASDPVALDTLATRYVGKWLAVLIDIAVFLDALAVMSAFMATTARGWFAVARAGLLPSPLARQSRRYGTPLGGNVLVVSAAIVLVIVTAIFQGSDANGQANVFNQFGIMTGLGSLLIETIYIFLAVAAIRFLLEEPQKWWQWIFLLVAIVTPFLGIYGSVVPFPAWPISLGVFGAITGVVLAAIWTLIMLRLRPVQVSKASEAYAWEGDEASHALY
ncbi:MAG: APC family permease [Ktedonobacteraceae bacterium]